MIFHMVFENEYGRLEMGGGQDQVKCRQAIGLGAPKKKFTTVSYTGEDGQHLVSEKRTARTISISVDITGGSHALSNALRVLSFSGTLLLHFGNRVRKISCYPSSVSDPVYLGPYIQLVIQFTCDNPDFLDEKEGKYAVFRRIDQISSPFTLPQGSGLVFTRRVNQADIINAGDLNAYPIFYLTGEKGDGADLLDEEEQGVLIRNLTTGQKIRLLHNISEGEEVVVDVDNRTVTGFIDGKETNLLDDLAEGTYLDQFYLVRGKNEIAVVNYNASSALTAVCAFSNRYVEAVY